MLSPGESCHPNIPTFGAELNIQHSQRVPNVVGGITPIDTELEAEIGRQQRFTAALSAGDFALADSMILEAEFNGQTSELNAFKDQRKRSEHEAVIATGDTDIMDAFVDGLEKEGRDHEVGEFWHRRSEAAHSPKITPNLRIISQYMEGDDTNTPLTRKQIFAKLADQGVRFTADNMGVMRIHITRGSSRFANVYRQGICLPLTGARMGINHRLLNENQLIVISGNDWPVNWNQAKINTLAAGRNERSQGIRLESLPAGEIAEKISNQALFPRMIAHLVLS